MVLTKLNRGAAAGRNRSTSDVQLLGLNRCGPTDLSCCCRRLYHGAPAHDVTSERNEKFKTELGEVVVHEQAVLSNIGALSVM